MTKFPIDAPKGKVIKALESLGFNIVREKEHISMIRKNKDGTKTPLTMPNHRKIKASTRFISSLFLKNILSLIHKTIMDKYRMIYFTEVSI